METLTVIKNVCLKIKCTIEKIIVNNLENRLTDIFIYGSIFGRKR